MRSTGYARIARQEVAMKARSLRALNRTRGTVLCGQLEDAGGVAGQTRGLLGRERLEPGHGMLFARGRFEPFMWMHMFFMRFAIDIVFLDRNGVVIKINPELKPWRISSVVTRARKALELPAGAAAQSGTAVGDSIALEEI
ncbi:MAG: DUF192 domain-containing protein [Candidatus Binataceae bacterium]